MVINLEDKVKEEINQKRVIKKYYAKDSKHYNWNYLKEISICLNPYGNKSRR